MRSFFACSVLVLGLVACETNNGPGIGDGGFFTDGGGQTGGTGGTGNTSSMDGPILVNCPPVSCVAPEPGCRYVSIVGSCGCGRMVCDQPRPLSSQDEVCGGGMGNVTPREVLARLRPTYQRTLLYWNESTRKYEDSPTALTIRTTHDDGAMICHPEFIPPDNSGAASQPVRVEVTITLELSTADGQFNENLPVTVSGTPMSWGTELPFNAEVQVGALMGNYAPALGGGASDVLSINGQFDGDQTSGGLTEILREPGSVMIRNLAIWRSP